MRQQVDVWPRVTCRLPSAAAPHTSQGVEVREEHTLKVLRCSVLRQEIPVAAAHISDPYFITVNSHYVHTLVLVPPGGTYSLGRSPHMPRVTLAKTKNEFFNHPSAAAGDTPPPAGCFGYRPYFGIITARKLQHFWDQQ